MAQLARFAFERPLWQKGFMPGTFLLTPAEHRQAAAGFRREAMQTRDRNQAPKLLQRAAEREAVAKTIERRVAEGTHKLPDRQVLPD